jgi:hypothetical protein
MTRLFTILLSLAFVTSLPSCSSLRESSQDRMYREGREKVVAEQKKVFAEMGVFISNGGVNKDVMEMRSSTLTNAQMQELVAKTGFDEARKIGYRRAEFTDATGATVAIDLINSK